VGQKTSLSAGERRGITSGGKASSNILTIREPSQIDSVEWDFDGNDTEDQTTTTLTTQFSYPTDGSFTAMVTVLDTDGGEAAATTTVTVQSPTQAITTANTLVQELPLNRGQQNSMTRKLDEAQDLLSQGDIIGACDKLSDVVSQLDAFVMNRRLSAEDAAPVLDEVHAIQQSLGCSQTQGISPQACQPGPSNGRL
jgi:hypothetical protein